MMMKSFLLYCFLCAATSLFAQNCSPGWEFYRDVTIDNSAGPVLTDYQVKVSLNTAQLAADGKLRGDGADLRVFTTDCTPLPFWGDSLGSSQKIDQLTDNAWQVDVSHLDRGIYFLQLYRFSDGRLLHTRKLTLQ